MARATTGVAFRSPDWMRARVDCGTLATRANVATEQGARASARLTVAVNASVMGIDSMPSPKRAQAPLTVADPRSDVRRPRRSGRIGARAAAPRADRRGRTPTGWTWPVARPPRPPSASDRRQDEPSCRYPAPRCRRLCRPARAAHPRRARTRARSERWSLRVRLRQPGAQVRRRILRVSEGPPAATAAAAGREGSKHEKQVTCRVIGVIPVESEMRVYRELSCGVCAAGRNTYAYVSGRYQLASS